MNKVYLFVITVSTSSHRTYVTHLTHLIIQLSTPVKERDTLPAEISGFHDYGQELTLSLLYYLEIGRNHRQK